jgi:hypothetical protein
MNCVVCERTLRTPNLVYCCAGCRLVVSMAAKGQVPSEEDFADYELGEYTAQEAILFLGRVVGAGIIEKLAPHYAVAVRSLLREGVIKEDGEVDLMKHEELTRRARHE